MDLERFAAACDCAREAERQAGIGTLGEKRMHAVLKYYFHPCPAEHEVPVAPFVADICTRDRIVEIQTRNFAALSRKLAFFLPRYAVTVVYPVVGERMLQWIDPNTGEVSKRRKTGKKDGPWTVLPELYPIREYLEKAGFELVIVSLAVEELRYLDGWSSDRKRGATKVDQFPVRLLGEWHLEAIEDYRCLIPPGLPTEFTVKDFMRCSRFRSRKAGYAVKMLQTLGLIEKIGQQGKAYVYQIQE